MRDRKQDPDLIRAFQDGDDGAFSRIFEQFRKPLLRYVGERVRDDEDAQDLVQEIFMKAYRFRASYDPTYAFTTWLWTIARNTAVDWSRRMKSAPETSDMPPEDLPSAAEAEALLERKIARKALRKLLGRMTALQRRAIWLRVIHQLSYDEISRRLGLTPSAVKSLLHRSREALRELGNLHQPALA